MKKILLFAAIIAVIAFASITFMHKGQIPYKPESSAIPIPIASTITKKTCHIAGDSIAFGTHQVLGGCSWDAKVGIPSADIINRVKPADFLVISSGTNDYSNPNLENNLEAARVKATG